MDEGADRPVPGSDDRYSSLLELFKVRLREFLREPEALFWTFGFPLLLAAGLGIAFRSRPPEVVNVAVVSSVPVAASVASELDAHPSVNAQLLGDSAAAQALRTARVALVVVPDAGGGVEYRYDPDRTEARAARWLVDDALQRGAGRADALEVREALVSERGARYIDFFIPGLLGLNLMGSGIWSIAFSIVTARNRKLLKRLVATPMSRVEYLLSFLLSRLVFLVLEVGALVGFGMLAFGVPMRGSWPALAGIALLASLTFGALGLLVAARATTVEGVSGLANLVMLPMWIFSGVFFAASNFPAAFQPFIQLLPLTATVDALRATMLEGVPISSVAGELGIVTAWGVLSFVVALKVFRWR